MKQPTRKSSILALVGSTGRGLTPAEERAAILKESFDGWLNSVAPALLHSTGNNQSEVKLPRRSLSYIDHLRVNRATVREGVVHRVWPPDVVLSFLAADVVKRNNKDHGVATVNEFDEFDDLS